ncbi:MAG TPA: hypothetical protein VHR35_17700 [Nocardioides sp.]|nr:hypothetical protein [Nocardioides sp.]
MTARVVLGLLGAGAAAYGVVRLLDLGWDNTRATVTWLVGGVVLHDAVLAPATLLVAFVALRLFRRRRLAPAVVVLVVLAPVTLLAVPELGRFGARADNPTLLDRNYWLGWSVLATLVLVGALVGALLNVLAAGRRTSVGGGDRGTGDGGR